MMTTFISMLLKLHLVLIDIMNEFVITRPQAVERDVWLFYDCCEFWKRMGVQKEDNIIALALADLINVCKKNFRLDDWNAYYKAIAEKAIAEIKKPKYNEGRGQNGFLAGSGL